MSVIKFNFTKDQKETTNNTEKSKFLYFKAYHNGGRVTIQENTEFNFSEYMMYKKDEFARNQLAKYKIFYLDSIRIEYLNDINGIRFYNKKEISVKEYKLYTSLSYLIRQVFDDKNDIDRIESFLHQINKNVKEMYRIDSNKKREE